MDENTLVSVIIVNYNGKNHLEKCLESLMKINYNNYEVILVDNNSSDGSIQFIEKFYPSIRLIKLKDNLGFAEPNNIAVKEAKGDLVLFLNNDTTVDPNFISEMIKVIKNDPKIAICQSLLLKPDGTVDSSGDFLTTLGRAYSSKEKPEQVREIFSPRGASMLVKKNIFIELGGFDKKFFVSFEDVDIGWRAWIWGYRVVVVPNSIVYHVGGQTVKTISSEIQFHGVKNNLVMRYTNFELHYAISSLIKFFFSLLLRKSTGISVIHDSQEFAPLPSFGILIRGLIWPLKNFKYVLEKRKKVNSRRVVSTKNLLEKKLIKK